MGVPYGTFPSAEDPRGPPRTIFDGVRRGPVGPPDRLESAALRRHLRRVEQRHVRRRLLAHRLEREGC
jgi:hypothetical protein